MRPTEAGDGGLWRGNRERKGWTMGHGSGLDSILYRAIRSRPEAIRSVLGGTTEGMLAAREVLLTSPRVFLVGTGTGVHAATVGGYLFRSAGLDAVATTGFDLANYRPDVLPGDAVLALGMEEGEIHSGAAVRRALSAGARVIGLTPSGPFTDGTEPETFGVGEASVPEAAGYSPLVAALAYLAARVAQDRGADAGAPLENVVGLPDRAAEVLGREAEVWSAAEALAEAGRSVLVGAGPNAATALQGALTIKESCRLVAEGFGLDAMAHGDLWGVGKGDLAVVIASVGPGLGQTADLVGTLRKLGARVFLVADERVAWRFPLREIRAEGGSSFSYPAVPEPLSPALAILPVQLSAAFAAHLLGRVSASGDCAHSPLAAAGSG